MYWDFEDFFMVFIMSLLSYGLIAIVKSMVAKFKAQTLTGDGRTNIMAKKDILDAIKLLFGAQHKFPKSLNTPLVALVSTTVEYLVLVRIAQAVACVQSHLFNG